MNQEQQLNHILYHMRKRYSREIGYLKSNDTFTGYTLSRDGGKVNAFQEAVTMKRVIVLDSNSISDNDFQGMPSSFHMGGNFDESVRYFIIDYRLVDFHVKKTDNIMYEGDQYDFVKLAKLGRLSQRKGCFLIMGKAIGDTNEH